MHVRLIFAIATFATLTACGSSATSNAGPDSATASATQNVDDLAAPASSHHSRHHRHHRRSSSTGNATPSSNGANSTEPAKSTGGAYPCDDTKFVAIQGEFASGALEGDQEVDVCGTVTRVLAARTTRSGLHGYYYLQVAPGDTIEIVSDLGQMDAPGWPWVKTGDASTVRGRYYYDSASSQGIDWTHHGTSRSWPSAGYVVVNGTQYQ